MNKEQDKRLDDLFKKKMEDPVGEIRYDEADWESMEQLLDKGKRRGFVYLLPILSGIAAFLLIMVGWWLWKPQSADQAVQQGMHLSADHQKASSSNGTGGTKPDTILELSPSVASARPYDTIMERQAQRAHKHFDEVADKNQTLRTMQEKTSNDNIQIAEGQLPDKGQDIANTGNPAGKSGDDSQNTGVTSQQPDKSAPVLAAAEPGKAVKKTVNSFRPQYTLSVIAAPDLNGVNSFGQSKVGTNIGLTFSVGLSKKITVSTGALYSVKPYLTSFSNYNTGSGYKWPVNPSSVVADCRMLDIPLNVSYQFYQRGQNRLALGTGLSSYLMLHESYKFNYANAAYGPVSYTVPHPGKYFFGVANLNITYERQINSKFGLSIQPYLKLPLSNVGYSQVKLQTTGVAVGFNWNLNSLTKP
ncbi:MAG TPA: hypothetical protein VHA56_14865 [Mucilaginibacter sp.]|nr:hypothetical protein [Mucilaginibacter sp.]